LWLEKGTLLDEDDFIAVEDIGLEEGYWTP
jgi:hypothetical protein